MDCSTTMTAIPGHRKTEQFDDSRSSNGISGLRVWKCQGLCKVAGANSPVHCHSRAGGNPPSEVWFPAFAGNTGCRGI